MRHNSLKRYLKPPLGYALDKPIEWHDLDAMKQTAKNLMHRHPQYEEFKKVVDKWWVKDARKFFKFNGFTFVKTPEETK